MTTNDLDRDLSHRFNIVFGGTDVHRNALPDRRCAALTRVDLSVIASAIEAAAQLSSGCELIQLERLAGTVRDLLDDDLEAAKQVPTAA